MVKWPVPVGKHYVKNLDIQNWLLTPLFGILFMNIILVHILSVGIFDGLQINGIQINRSCDLHI